MGYQIFTWVQSFGVTIFWAVIVLGALIFIHELGHYLAAKKLGIGVHVFSLGFGRKLIGFQRGGTEYRVSLIPLGGYVKLVGENSESDTEEAEDPAASFFLRPVSHRFLVIAAGPGFNLIFAFLLSWALHIVGVPIPGTWVGEVLPGAPAMQAGLRAGDHIVAIDGKPIRRWTELVAIIQKKADTRIVLRVERGRKIQEIPIVPTSKTAEGKELGFGRIGIGLGSQTVIERSGPVDALRRSAIHNINIVSLTVGALYRIITGAVPVEIGGPIRISAIAAEQAQRGLRFLVGFTILLSVNLAILNLLPIPVLDGGHIFFLLLEVLRGKPLGGRVRDMAMQVGMVLLIGLMLFATFKDSVYYFSRWTSGAPGERRRTAPPEPPAQRPVPSEGR